MLNFLKKVFLRIGCAFVLSQSVLADDWGSPGGTIETMYVYPNYVVVVQSVSYLGTAGCNNYPTAWSFNWSDFDSATQQRIYSTLLAAKLARTPIKPIFTNTGCGPEGYKKFNGQFVL